MKPKLAYLTFPRQTIRGFLDTYTASISVMIIITSCFLHAFLMGISISLRRCYSGFSYLLILHTTETSFIFKHNLLMDSCNVENRLS